MFLKQKRNQKKSKTKENLKGSVLAFSLVIVATMLMIVIGMSSVSMIHKKDASATQASVQAYQIADSGALWATKKINTAIRDNAAISSQFDTCSGGVVSNLTDNVPTPGSFDLYFFDISGNQISDCDSDASLVARIKAVGKFKNTVRAIDIATIVPSDPPIAWWKMNEASWNGTAGEVVDSTEEGHDGNSFGGASTVVGKFDNAGNFDGTDDYVELGAWFNYQIFSISMWLKPGSSQVQWADIIDNNHAGSPHNRNWVFQQNDTSLNNYNFGTINADGTDCNVSNINLESGVWQHVEIVRDSDNLSVYKNGSLIGSATNNCSKSINYSDQDLRLGNWGLGGRNWKGLMDDVRFYNYARTATQVLEDMNEN